MAIETLTMYTCVCDVCGKSADTGTDYSCWNEPNRAKEIAMYAGWLQMSDGKDYCTDCFSGDEDDNLVIKQKKEDNGMQV